MCRPRDTGLMSVRSTITYLSATQPTSSS
jgi:hypothetical protein